MQDELIASYMTVLNESNDSQVKGATPKAGSNALGDFKKGNESDENVDLDSPSDDKDLSVNVKEGSPKKLKESKSTFKNPFDELYNKIVSENSFGFSTEDDNEIEPSDDLEGGDLGEDGLGEVSDDLGSDLGDDLGGEGDIEDMDMEGDDLDGEEIDMGTLVSTLRDVLSQLEKIVGDDDESEDGEIDDIEDLGDESDDEDGFGSEDEESEEDESEDEEEEDEDGEKNPFAEGFKRKQGDKEKGKKKKGCKGKFEKFSKKDVTEEAVKIKGLKKGVNLTPFKGNIKGLQNKKAEVTNNTPKASKSKAQTPSTGKGYDGAVNKMSPTAGHNLMKASSHSVSGAVKTGKNLFEQ